MQCYDWLHSWYVPEDIAIKIAKFYLEFYDIVVLSQRYQSSIPWYDLMESWFLSKEEQYHESNKE